VVAYIWRLAPLSRGASAGLTLLRRPMPEKLTVAFQQCLTLGAGKGRPKLVCLSLPQTDHGRRIGASKAPYEKGVIGEVPLQVRPYAPQGFVPFVVHGRVLTDADTPLFNRDGPDPKGGAVIPDVPCRTSRSGPCRPRRRRVPELCRWRIRPRRFVRSASAKKYRCVTS
jgi:hypothetical protein